MSRRYVVKIEHRPSASGLSVIVRGTCEGHACDSVAFISTTHGESTTFEKRLELATWSAQAGARAQARAARREVRP